MVQPKILTNSSYKILQNLYCRFRDTREIRTVRWIASCKVANLVGKSFSGGRSEFPWPTHVVDINFTLWFVNELNSNPERWKVCHLFSPHWLDRGNGKWEGRGESTKESPKRAGVWSVISIIVIVMMPVNVMRAEIRGRWGKPSKRAEQASKR